MINFAYRVNQSGACACSLKRGAKVEMDGISDTCELTQCMARALFGTLPV